MLNPKIPLLLLVVLSTAFTSFSQIMISATPGKIDSSAMLEVRSSDRGFLPSRMSTAQRKAIKNPAPGLMVYDTTKQRFYGYLKNEGWKPFLMGYDTATLSDAYSPSVIMDNAAGDQLGSAVAINGDLAVASAPKDDINANTDQGSLYVFRRQNGVWTNTQKLTAPDGAAGDQFGSTVAMSDSFVLVTALFDDIGENADQGSVYVYKIQNGTLIYHQKIVSPLASAYDAFGYFLAVQKDQLFIGAPNDDITGNADQGSAYYYKLADGYWTEAQKIIQDSAASSLDYFGYGISIDSAMVSIGCHINTTGNYGYSQNAVFIYEKVNGLWQRRQKVLQPDVSTGDRYEAFGYNTVLKNGFLTVGAWLHDALTENKDRGSAYVFKKNGNNWTSIQKLTPADEYFGDAYGDYFGSAMSSDGKYMVSGSGYEDIAPGLIDRGAFYLYQWIGGQWVEKKKVTEPAPVSLDLFGHKVAIEGGNIIVSASNANSGKGKVYFYSIDD